MSDYSYGFNMNKPRKRNFGSKRQGLMVRIICSRLSDEMGCLGLSLAPKGYSPSYWEYCKLTTLSLKESSQQSHIPSSAIACMLGPSSYLGPFWTAIPPSVLPLESAEAFLWTAPHPSFFLYPILLPSLPQVIDFRVILKSPSINFLHVNLILKLGFPWNSTFNRYNLCLIWNLVPHEFKKIKNHTQCLSRPPWNKTSTTEEINSRRKMGKFTSMWK